MNNEITNRIKNSAILMVVTLVIVVGDVLAIQYGFLTFGQMVNKFYPCTSNFFPATPPHCSLGYDFLLFEILAGLFILLLLKIIVEVVLFARRNKKL